MASRPEHVILTYEDLVEMPNDRNRYELFEGELQVTAAPNISHQATSGNLYFILTGHVRRYDLGSVFTAPCDVLLSEISVVEPDLLFVSKERREIIRSQYIRGAPDLVVEILSPSTSHVDRHIKMQLYARHAVPNFWRLDPDRQEFVAYTLEGGEYRQVTLGSEDDTVSAPPFPDLVIPLAEIWGW